MNNLRGWIGGGCLGASIAGYLIVGTLTAIAMGVIGETSNEAGAWWCNPAVCVFAWPAVWAAAYQFAVANG